MNGDERTKENALSNNRAEEDELIVAPGTAEAMNDSTSAAREGVEDTGEPDWKEEAEKYRDRFLRSQADMDNVRKRLEREKTELIKFANENLAKDLLPVLDNLERALIHGQDNSGSTAALLEGVRLTYEGLWSVLEKFGVTAVSALNQKFDPNFHEAVMQREDPDAEDNSVIEEVQKGYLLHERLIRPAMVVVSRKPAPGNE